jgi:hypothetical protein
MLISKIALTKDFIRLTILIVVVALILEVYYNLLIVPEFKHLGFNLNFNIVKYILSKFLLICLLALSFIIYSKSKFLYSIFLLLLFFFYIPNSILFSFANGALGPFFSNCFFVSTFALSIFVKIKLPVWSISQKHSSWILAAATILFTLPIIITFRSNIYLKTLLLKDIYETREVFSAKLTGVVNYLYHLSVKTILPVSLVFFMIRKKPVFIGLCLIVLLYLFVISGNKFVYFTSILLVFFYYVGKDYVSKINYFLLFTIILFIVFPIVDYAIIKADKPILSGTFVNRFLFIPALLTQWYFDFFDGRPFYFAESHFFNNFFHSPYDMPVGFLISKTYLNTTDAYANNGIVSDGFMNLGYWGVGLFSIVFAALFGLFNSLRLNIGYYGLFFSYIYMILSAPLLSCFITGGILLFIFLSIFVLREKDSTKQ